MNMVRAGKVKSPEDWPQNSAHELTGGRKRHRIVDREKLLGRMGFIPGMASEGGRNKRNEAI